MSKNLNVTLTDEENEELETLVEFFQNKSISNVTKSDVTKFIIDRCYNLIKNPDTKTILDDYKKMGIIINADNINQFANELNKISEE